MTLVSIDHITLTLAQPISVSAVHIILTLVPSKVDEVARDRILTWVSPLTLPAVLPTPCPPLISIGKGASWPKPICLQDETQFFGLTVEA